MSVVAESNVDILTRCDDDWLDDVPRLFILSYSQQMERKRITIQTMTVSPAEISRAVDHMMARKQAQIAAVTGRSEAKSNCARQTWATTNSATPGIYKASPNSASLFSRYCHLSPSISLSF